MESGWNILLIEDNFDDRLVLREKLQNEVPAWAAPVFRIAEAETLAEGLQAIESQPFDVVLLDLRLPDSVGLESYKLVSRKAPGTPVIILTEMRDSSKGLEAVRQGAQDYLIKSEVKPALLLRSIRYAMQREAHLQEKQEIIEQLQETLRDIKQLQGLVPICSRCKKVRTDGGYWKLVEDYLEQHPDIRLLHGLCPECAAKQYDNE